LVSVFLIAVSLAMDALAVSVSSGISVPGFGRRQALRMGLWFGTFQFAMPLFGWFLGSGIAERMERAGHVLAFAILALIGGRMIYGALHADGDGARGADLTAPRLALLAVATSIDALAAGVSMAFMDVNILLSAVIIGVVAFLLSVLGGLAGRKLGGLFQKRAEIAGGLVLIALGVKILVEYRIYG